MIRRYIFKRNLMQKYMMAFNNYMIYTMYGDNVLLAEDLLKEEEEEA